MNAQERKKYKKDKEAKERVEDPIREKLDLDGKEYLANLKNPIEEAVSFAKRLLNEDIKDLHLRIQAFSRISNLFVKQGYFLTAKYNNIIRKNFACY